MPPAQPIQVQPVVPPVQVQSGTVPIQPVPAPAPVPVQQPPYYQQPQLVQPTPTQAQPGQIPVTAQPPPYTPQPAQNQSQVAQYPPPAQPAPGAPPPTNYNNQQTTQQINVHLPPAAAPAPPPVVPVLTQPVGFMQGRWTRSMGSVCCDGKTCYAIFCTPCARGESSEKMGGGYCFGFIMQLFCPCISCCMLCDERNRIRARYHIPDTDCCCTCCAVCWCEPCVLSQHLYQLEGIRFF
ncbi:Oidioi.mRNA.OKI2018_I69.PAR.g11244.t1.cds [Oikopleura dioica]|uniref:Oidioi.mRNA.OKI2018_I69.PAR.g11244.t1.cds n=1 Tax=Oikopleura dioica TaxID=34765 RepID=A0ABN7S1L9_OIKDI|nr:Oidioi.mRNA.OKI2018_I69.PAR.g11244.t1.cds [Oikopleura dioica]